ncbi:MAG: hypothetical protein IPP90_16015 [Gemmatimonadaceae bacterium]|nr:hypothetical protein [Gemmatimonadaceae bacterium]
MKRADTPAVFTVASVLEYLMSQNALSDDAESFAPPMRIRPPLQGFPENWHGDASAGAPRSARDVEPMR